LAHLELLFPHSPLKNEENHEIRRLDGKAALVRNVRLRNTAIETYIICVVEAASLNYIVCTVISFTGYIYFIFSLAFFIILSTFIILPALHCNYLSHH